MKLEKIFIELKKNLKDENIPHEKSPVSDRVTISVGVCFKHFEKTLNLKESIKEADKALYISKENGRNRFTII